LAGLQKSTGLTYQALIIHSFAKIFLAIRHVLTILFLLSALECIEHGGDEALSNIGVICFV
jgi:hypothetical protein